MKRFWMQVLRCAFAATLLALVVAGCGKEVCKGGIGPVFEVKAQFDFAGLRDRAAVLEFDSRIVVKDPSFSRPYPDYTSRRIGRMVFPDAARDGSETFVLDPGKNVQRVMGASRRYEVLLFIRVYDDTGQLLAEGRFRKEARADQCYLSQSVRVSASGSCEDKVEGDLCPLSGSQARVCQDTGDGLRCHDSSCGDGYVDLQAGELCDPGMSDASVTCGRNCLPLPVSTTLWDTTTLGSPHPSWLELSTPTSPPARERAAGASMGSDYLLFGGRDATGHPLGDAWLFDGSSWTPVDAGNPSPPARWGHVMTYFPREEKVVLFGGTDIVSQDSTPVATMQDLWSWDAAEGWSEVSVTGPTVPPPLHSAALAEYADGDTDGAMLFGGVGGDGSVSSDLYLLTMDATGQGTWTQPSLSGDIPSGRFGHSLAPLPDHSGALILAGGQNATDMLGGVYEVDLTTNSPSFHNRVDNNGTSCSGSPPQCGSFRAMVPLSGGPEMLVYGGRSSARQVAEHHVTRLWDSLQHEVTDESFVADGGMNVPLVTEGYVAFSLGEKMFLYGGRRPEEHGFFGEISDRTWVYDASGIGEPADYLSPKRVFSSAGEMSMTSGLLSLGAADASGVLPDVSSALVVGDLDGDGGYDLALGMPGSRKTLTGVSSKPAGLTYVFETSVPGDQKLIATGGPWKVFFGPKSRAWSDRGAWLGAALAAGDLNGDGIDDLVLGAPARAEGGGVYIVFGGARVSGTNELGQIPITDTPSPLIFESTDDSPKHAMFLAETTDASPAPDQFGYAVAVGDLDGDGFGDVAMGAPLRGDAAAEAGAVYLVSGGEAISYPNGGAGAHIGEANVRRRVLRSSTIGLRLGVSLAVGDVNGDGIVDLLVGSAPDAGADCTPPACGAVVVIWGRPNLFAGGEDLALEALDPQDGVLLAASASDDLRGMGSRVVSVDLDVDGRAEVATALHRPDARLGTPDAVAIFRGQGMEETFGPGGIDAGQGTHLLLRTPAGQPSGLGLHLARGDVNGDRREDLLIGAPYEAWTGNLSGPTLPVKLSHAGALHVVLGSRRATLWDAGGELVIGENAGFDSTDGPPIALLSIYGGLSEGYLGSASATIRRRDATRTTRIEEDPTLNQIENDTVVWQPGWFLSTGAERFQGGLRFLLLGHLLPCGREAACPLPAVDSTD